MFETARETLLKGLARFRNRQFLDAAMAAAALMATADGEVTFSERAALDDVLETVTNLQIYDPHVAVDIYRDFADAILRDREAGRAEAFRAIGRVEDNPDAAELVIRVAIAISRADGDYSPLETKLVGELCRLLDLPIPAVPSGRPDGGD